MNDLCLLCLSVLLESGICISRKKKYSTHTHTQIKTCVHWMNLHSRAFLRKKSMQSIRAWLRFYSHRRQEQDKMHYMPLYFLYIHFRRIRFPHWCHLQTYKSTMTNHWREWGGRMDECSMWERDESCSVPTHIVQEGLREKNVSQTVLRRNHAAL